MTPPEPRRNPLARAFAPVREMLTPALRSLLLFQVLSGILVAPLFSLFPVYVEARLGLPASFTGTLRALFVVMGGIMAFLGSMAVDALGRKRAYLLGMTGVVASAGLFLTTSPTTMLLLGLYAGLMFGLGSVAGQAYLMDSVGRQSLGLATALYFMTGTAGNAVGNFAAGRLDHLPHYYRLLGLTMLGGQVLQLLLAARLMPELPRAAPTAEAGASGVLGALLRRRDVQLLLVVRFFPTVYWGIVTLAIPLVLFRLTGREAAASDYVALSLVVSGVCQVAVGRLVDHFGPRGPLIAAAGTLALSAVALALLSRSVWGIYLFGIIGSGAAWSVSVTMPTVIQELTTPETKARLLGITHAAWSVGFVAGTVAAGFLADVPGREPLAFQLGAACYAGALLAAGGLLSRMARGPGA